MEKRRLRRSVALSFTALLISLHAFGQTAGSGSGSGGGGVSGSGTAGNMGPGDHVGSTWQSGTTPNTSPFSPSLGATPLPSERPKETTS